MNDAARFALAIAAILSATALDAHQRSASEASYAIASGTLTVRSSQPDDLPLPKPASLEALASDGGGSVSASDAWAHAALTDEFDHADMDGRTGGSELDRSIANTTVP